MRSTLERELKEIELALHRKPPARMQRHDVRKDDERPVRLPAAPKRGKRYALSQAAGAIIPDNGAVVRGRLQTKAGLTVGLDHTAIRRGDPGACTASFYQMYIERAAQPDTPGGPVLSAKQLAELEPSARYKLGASYAATARPARYAQQYNEQGNIELVENRPTSFGNLGDTPAERDQFWRLMELAERQNGIVQHRLVVELPYDVSSAERAQIVRTFCAEEFESRGLRYWAVVHAPDKHNDARNFHAHIAYSARPAGKVLDGKRVPDNTLGAVWDFAIVDTYLAPNRTLRARSPFKQPKNREIDQRRRVATREDGRVITGGWLTQARERLARLNNEALRRAGSARQYTALSYKAQGVQKIRGPHMGAKAAGMELEGKRTDKGRDVMAFQVDYYTREMAGGAYEGLERTKASFDRLASVIGQIEQRLDDGVRPGAIRAAEEAKAEYLESLQRLMLAIADLKAEDTLDARRKKKVEAELQKLQARRSLSLKAVGQIKELQDELALLQAKPTLQARKAKAAVDVPALIAQAELRREAFQQAAAGAEKFLAEIDAFIAPAATATVERPAKSGRIAGTRLPDRAPGSLQDSGDNLRLAASARTMNQRMAAKRVTEPRWRRSYEEKQRHAQAPVHDPVANKAVEEFLARQRRREPAIDVAPTIEPVAAVQPVAPVQIQATPAIPDALSVSPARPTPPVIPEVRPAAANAAALGATAPAAHAQAPAQSNMLTTAVKQPAQSSMVQQPATQAQKPAATITAAPLPAATIPATPVPVTPVPATPMPVAPVPTTPVPAAPASATLAPVASSSVNVVPVASTPVTQVQAASLSVETARKPAPAVPVAEKTAAPATVPAAARTTTPTVTPPAKPAARVPTAQELLNQRVIEAMNARQGKPSGRLNKRLFRGAEWAAGAAMSPEAGQEYCAKLVGYSREQFLEAYIRTKNAIKALNAIASDTPDQQKGELRVLIRGMRSAIRHMDYVAPFQAYTISASGYLDDHALTSAELLRHAEERDFPGGPKNKFLAPLWAEIEQRHEGVRRRAEIDRAITKAMKPVAPQKLR